MSDRELLDLLPRALGRAVTSVRRAPHEYRSSFAIERLDVAFAGGGAPQRLVLKAVGPGDLGPEGTAAKPAFLLDPRREIAVYRDVLGPAGVSAPRLLGSISDAASGRFWLLLEHVDGTPLWQVGARAAWERAAAWLGELHARLPAPRGDGLLAHDERFLRVWLRRALASVAPGSLDHVRAGYERVLERLLAWPPTLVHGDFFAANVLVEPAGDIRPVDWELAGPGPGLLDLATLTCGAWTEAERDGLVDAYRRAFTASGGRLSAPDLATALPHFRLQVALQRLGWSSTAAWTPPPEHVHDWLAEARDAAAAAGL